MVHSRMYLLLTAVVAVPLCLTAAACGEDEGGGGSAPKRRAGASRAGKAKADKVVDETDYGQIREQFRRKLGEPDFRPDSTGNENRDPFRSYVIAQGNVGRGASPGATLQPTEVCTAKNSKAPGYSLRDLRLIGIVLRGTRSYAQFRDSLGYGWIVRRGDCLGKEKAIVQAIGVGSVTLEVVPEAPPNQEPPPPERKDIPLHTDELTPDTDTVEEPVE